MSDAKADNQNSIKHLANLYTVIVGLALSTAVLNLIDVDGHIQRFEWSTGLLFLAFITTLLPFYHGAMRHLDLAYAEGGEQRGAAPLLADFVILFTEGCFFLGIAALIQKPIWFAWGFVMLLAVDVLWGFAAYLAFPSKRASKPELKWCWINLCTIAIFGVFFYSEKLLTLSPPSIDTFILSTVVLFIAFFRTIVDYALTWDIYR